VLLEVLYAAGLRVSELAGLTWSDVLTRDKGQVQLSIIGKGGVVRRVLLPEAVSRSLLALRGDAGANDAVRIRSASTLARASSSQPSIHRPPWPPFAIRLGPRQSVHHSNFTMTLPSR
jgi:site-specific recombinase XerC